MTTQPDESVYLTCAEQVAILHGYHNTGDQADLDRYAAEQARNPTLRCIVDTTWSQVAPANSPTSEPLGFGDAPTGAPPAEQLRNSEAYHAAYLSMQPHTRHAQLRAEIADHAVRRVDMILVVFGRKSVEELAASTVQGADMRRALVASIVKHLGSGVQVPAAAVDAAVRAAAATMTKEN